MKTKRSIKTVVTAAIILAAGCVLAGVVDQRQESLDQNTSWGVFSNEYGMARNIALWQSFQAGMSEDFLGVELCWGSSSQAATIDLCLYSGTGVDTNSLIHRETITIPELVGQNWWRLSFSNSHPSLVIGNTYTFSLEEASLGDVGTLYAGSAGVDSYTNGIFWMQGYSSHHDDYTVGDTNWDVGFRTVMVPEPATATMLALSGLLIVGYRRFFGRV